MDHTFEQCVTQVVRFYQGATPPEAIVGTIGLLFLALIALTKHNLISMAGFVVRPVTRRIRKRKIQKLKTQ